MKSLLDQLPSNLLASQDIGRGRLDRYEKKVVVQSLETLDDSVTQVVEVKLQEKNKIEKGEGGGALNCPLEVLLEIGLCLVQCLHPFLQKPSVGCPRHFPPSLLLIGTGKVVSNLKKNKGF